MMAQLPSTSRQQAAAQALPQALREQSLGTKRIMRKLLDAPGKTSNGALLSAAFGRLYTTSTLSEGVKRAQTGIMDTLAFTVTAPVGDPSGSTELFYTKVTKNRPLSRISTRRATAHIGQSSFRIGKHGNHIGNDLRLSAQACFGAAFAITDVAENYFANVMQHAECLQAQRVCVCPHQQAVFSACDGL
jgi:hypothetical protein